MPPLVLLDPQSGYINRLQAMASAAGLADDLGGEWKICWRQSSVAPADPHDLFAQSFIDDRFISASEVADKWSIELDNVPIYLTLRSEGRHILLRGHDQGEQYFMPRLRDLTAQSDGPDVVVLVAGGKFNLREDERSSVAVSRRATFYRELPFAPEILDQLRIEIRGHDAFLGLHLRYTDRSLQSPSPRSVLQALKEASSSTKCRSVFMASDSIDKRDMWLNRLEGLNYDVWFRNLSEIDRSKRSSAVDAMLDWLMLAHARSVIYFRESSFGEEAAVASGFFEVSRPVEATRFNLLTKRARHHAANAISYPKRHWLT